MSPQNFSYGEAIHTADESMGWYASLGQDSDLSGKQTELSIRATQMLEHGNKKHTIYAGDMFSEAARLVDDQDKADELREKAQNAYEKVLVDDKRYFEDYPEAIKGLENLETQKLYDDLHKYETISVREFINGLLKIQHSSAIKFLETDKAFAGRQDYSLGKMLEWAAVIAHRQQVIERRDASTLIRSSFLREDRGMNVNNLPEERDIREFNFDIAHEVFVDGRWQHKTEGGKFAISDHVKQHPYDKSIVVINFLIPHRELERGMLSMMKYVIGEVRYIANPTQNERFRANPVDKSNARKFLALAKY